MSSAEVSAIYDAQMEEYKNKWEQTRLISYYAASGMRDMPDIKKFMPFPWDNDSIPTNNKNKIKPSKERMNQIIEAINGNKL